MEDNNGAPQYYDEYEIDLREYIMLLWNKKWFIAGFVIIVVMGAFVFSSFVLSTEYESEASILAPEIELLNNQNLNKESYITFLTSDIVLTEIQNYINQNRTEENEISQQGLLNRLTYELSDNTDQIDFVFQFHESEKTSLILEEWLDIYIAYVDEYVEEQNNIHFASIQNKIDEDFSAYNSILNELTKFKAENNLSLLNKDLTSKENTVISLNSEIIELRRNLDSDKIELDYIKGRKENTEQYMVKRNIISDEFLQKLEVINDNQELIKLLNTEEEFLNPAYERLLIKEINLSTAINSNKTKIDSIEKDIENLNEDIIKLQTKISTLSEKELMLEEQLSEAKEDYQNSNTELSSLRQQLAENNYEITIIVSSTEPDNPVSPNTKLNMAIAAVLALMLAVFVIFFIEFMKED
ncbi:MAG: hypothetical protein D5S01_10635 [Halanaerobium sp. MSAO_Bac5]|nr:MAG: hypothetical protein D5S01_10635 [Halanaerobium sp. MSAO_Bac5]